MNEGAADAAVAIGERVDGLELGVGDGRLDDGREVRPVHEGHEIDHQLLDDLGGWRHEVGPARVKGVAADPVLPVPQRPGDLRRGGRQHEHAMQGQDVGQAQGPGARTQRHGRLHGRHVAQDGPGRLVPGGTLFGLGAGEPALGEHQPLDPGRRHRLGAQQTPREDLEAGHPWRIPVQRIDSALSTRDRSCDPRRQRELQAGDEVGNEGAVPEGAALRPTAGGGGVSRPRACFVPSHGKRRLTSGSHSSRFNA